MLYYPTHIKFGFVCAQCSLHMAYFMMFFNIMKFLGATFMTPKQVINAYKILLYVSTYIGT